MTQARLELDDYTTRVLDVIKGKYGLKNRSEALKRLAQEKGCIYVEPKPNETVLRELDEIYEGHKKQNKSRRMTEKELDGLLSIE